MGQDTEVASTPAGKNLPVPDNIGRRTKPFWSTIQDHKGGVGLGIAGLLIGIAATSPLFAVTGLIAGIAAGTIFLDRRDDRFVAAGNHAVNLIPDNCVSAGNGSAPAAATQPGLPETEHSAVMADKDVPQRLVATGVRFDGDFTGPDATAPDPRGSFPRAKHHIS
jgi:hypothetical protein